MRHRWLLACLLVALVLLPSPNIFAYDPFEEESSTFGPATEDEYEDEIFFSEGRLLMAGLHAGYRSFTHNLGRIVDMGPLVGGYIDYFFSRMFAAEIATDYSLHRHHANNSRGDLGLLDFTVRGKFFVTGERFSDILDLLNPHVLAGAGFYWRFANEAAFGRSVRNTGWGFPFGIGLEIPVSGKDVFLGLEYYYELIFFGDENTVLSNGDPLDGDVTGLVGTLSFQF